MINKKIVNKDDLEKMFNVKIKGIFNYGSYIYKNKTPDDIDFIIIVEKLEAKKQETYLLGDVTIEITFYSYSDFKALINIQNLAMIECKSLFISKKEVFCDQELSDFFSNHIIDKLLIRSWTSKQSSNSYVKAKKKILTKEHFDKKVSLKSLWHSFRMVDFAMQVIKFGRVKDFSSSNSLYDEIFSDYDKMDKFSNIEIFWNYIHEKYKPIQNEYLSKLRELAPKQ